MNHGSLQIINSKQPIQRNIVISLSPNDDEIDWDADLFSQIDTKSSGNKQIKGTVNDMANTIDLDDCQWEMTPYKTNDNIKAIMG